MPEPLSPAEPIKDVPVDNTELPAPAAAPMTPDACAARLAELFPALFAPNLARPVKLRIHVDIQQRAPGVFTRKALSLFLHRHTTSNAYLKALATAAQRFDLDGAAAGELADEHRQAAVAELERRRALHEARRVEQRKNQRADERQRERSRNAERQPKPRVAPPARPPQRPPQRPQAPQPDDAARERAGLLRAWESSPLTKANFCALKRLPEHQFDAILAQAHQEREGTTR